MSDAAQLYQKILTDTIRKQIIILGPQITLAKVHNIPNLTVTDDGNVVSLGQKPEETVTRFLEEFRDLSTPLVKKTMQPLLSAIGTGTAAQTPPPPPDQNNPKENKNQVLVPNA
jgi:hypothetical protein